MSYAYRRRRKPIRLIKLALTEKEAEFIRLRQSITLTVIDEPPPTTEPRSRFALETP